jgi:2-polyprenyl-3-methyl-5-hydroxy-6-metoxy-1,4-benzoquinol methylase
MLNKGEIAKDESCRLCGGELDRTLLVHKEPDRFERSVGVTTDGYRRAWVACSRCGSASNILDPAIRAALDRISAEYYEIDLGQTALAERYEKIMALSPAESDNAGRVSRTLSFTMEWQARLPQRSRGPLRVLDIGAGLGVYLSGLLRQAAVLGVDCAAQAVEPDPNATDHLRSLGLFSVHKGLFSGQDTFRGYDLVTLNKVVEHVADPHRIVRDATKALNPDKGLLYIEVPDVLTIGRRPDTDNILGSLHHHLYSLRGLENVLQASRLVPLRLERILEPSGKITVFGFACPESAFDEASGLTCGS